MSGTVTMVNVMKFYISMLHKLMKSIGMHPIDVEIEPGTVIHFWVNDNKERNNKIKEGKEKKKPSLLLIQGFAGTGILTWQFQVLALRKKYTLYIPDLIFFGGSYTNKTDRTPRFQADCFAIGLKKLGVEEKCVVVGFSYGGFVGFQMAEHYPDLVGLLVVIGSVLAVSESIYKDTLKRIGFSNFVDFLLPTTVEGIKVLLKIGSYKLPWMPNLFHKHFLETMFSNRKERAELLDDVLMVKDEEVTEHHFQQSIHLLWGNDDKIFDLEVAKTLKEKLGETAELQVIKNAGYLLVLERPFAFNKRLKKILLEYSHSQAVANKNNTST